MLYGGSTGCRGSQTLSFSLIIFLGHIRFFKKIVTFLEFI